MKTETAAPAQEFRARHTQARVTATETRWDCAGCGKGRPQKGAVEFAKEHARHCTVLPLP